MYPSPMAIPVSVEMKDLAMPDHPVLEMGIIIYISHMVAGQPINITGRISGRQGCYDQGDQGQKGQESFGYYSQKLFHDLIIFFPSHPL